MNKRGQVIILKNLKAFVLDLTYYGQKEEILLLIESLYNTTINIWIQRFIQASLRRRSNFLSNKEKC